MPKDLTLKDLLCAKESDIFLDMKSIPKIEGWYRVQYNVLRFFYEKQRMSAFRLYVILMNDYQGSLHLRDYEELAKKVGIRCIKKLVAQLYEIGALKYRNEYWSTITPRKELYPTESKWNPCIHIKLEQLRDIKILNSLDYLKDIKIAVFLSKKNNKQKNPKESKRKCNKVSESLLSEDLLNLRAETGNNPRFGGTLCTPSFTKAIAKRYQRRETIWKHYKRLVAMGFILTRIKFDDFMWGDFEACQKQAIQNRLAGLPVAVLKNHSKRKHGTHKVSGIVGTLVEIVK